MLVRDEALTATSHTAWRLICSWFGCGRVVRVIEGVCSRLGLKHVVVPKQNLDVRPSWQIVDNLGHNPLVSPPMWF